ncbi:MAG: 16S rRNA (guanine(966)-N(2))-methyltransferase RsmD [Chloroflexota bacterium]
MAKIRVISGSARGRRLKLVPGDITRPITDRVKESLFNILQQDIPGCVFLDLFSGTGSVGIEALSRGASFVRFVDKNRPAINTIKENLKITGLSINTDILQIDAFTLLRRKPDKQFDYVFIAPPQYHDLWNKAVELLDSKPDWLVDDGWAVAQIDPIEYKQLELVNFTEFDKRKYGSTLLVFFERNIADDG